MYPEITSFKRETEVLPAMKRICDGGGEDVAEVGFLDNVCYTGEPHLESWETMTTKVTRT